MQVYVNFEDKRWKKYNIDFNRIATAAGPKRRGVEVSITLTNDKEIHKLNKQYRGIDKPTNVLSFELGDDLLLGDIYISLDTVLREAADAGISVDEHTAHMVVHGMLHLQGYDHIQDDEAVVMESKEITIMKKLGYKNPYADVCKCDCENCDCKNCSCCNCPGDKTISFFRKIKIRENSFWQYALYALFGGVAAFGFAPFYMWWMTVIGIVGAYWLTVRRRQYGCIWLEFLRASPFGAMYAISMLWWTLNSIYIVPELAKQFAVWTIPALIGIGLFGVLFFTWPFVAIANDKINSAQRVFMFSGVWTIVLWLREWMFTGFPWNPIANITLPFATFANSMSVWGALGLTFIIIGIIVAAFELLRNSKSVTNIITCVFFVIIAVCGGIVGVHNITAATSDSNDSVKIRIVQPAQTQSQKMVYSRESALKRAEENLVNLFKLASSDDTPVDLVVFPETTYPYTIIDSDDMLLAGALKTNVVIGANYFSNNEPYNSMIVAGSDGTISNIYSKSHLVPFGEYSLFGFMPSPAHLARGGGAEIISIDINGSEFVFAPAICYEIIFSDSLIPNSELQPHAIINITNDTWFGKTPGTYQHLDMVRRYAIESGIPVIRANYSGISAFVLSDGEILTSLPIGQSGVLDGTVWGAHKTIYRTVGRNGMMIIILLIVCLGVITTGSREKQ